MSAAPNISPEDEAKGQTQESLSQIPTDDSPQNWPEPKTTLSAGAAVQTLGECWEDATRHDWEAQWADLAPGEYSIATAVRLLSLNRGRDKAFIHDPWRKLLADCCCLEWKNLKPHFEALVFEKRMIQVHEVSGGAELWLLPRKNWRAVKTRGGIKTRMRALLALRQIVEGNRTLQLLLALPPIAVPRATPETQAPDSVTPEIQYSGDLLDPDSWEKREVSRCTTPETQASRAIALEQSPSKLYSSSDQLPKLPWRELKNELLALSNPPGGWSVEKKDRLYQLALGACGGKFRSKKNPKGDYAPQWRLHVRDNPEKVIRVFCMLLSEKMEGKVHDSTADLANWLMNQPDTDP